ncbi:MAG: amino acid permease [Bacteroidetes bacterium]|nr:amino acid permease [Bacteroidota bacterium]
MFIKQKPLNENLKREIGIFSLALAIINITIGTGIFVIPAIIAQNLGAAAILAYLVCGVLIFLVALCFAEVGSTQTKTGGIYVYIESAFGPFAGFIANNLYWFGASVVSDAALANALADILQPFYPFLEEGIYRIIFFLLIFGGLALLNIRSVKYGLRFVEIATIAKLIPLVILVIIGMGFIQSENLQWVTMPHFESIGSASLLLFFAFMGMETPLTNGGEIKNVSRTVPLGIFIGITVVLLLYISIQVISQGVLGNQLSMHKEAPLAAVANVVFGNTGKLIIIVAMSISILGALGGEILSMPRMLFAGARDGLMPKMLAKIHPQFFTPHHAIICYAALGFIMAACGGFKQLAILASASALINYLGVVLATIKLRKQERLSSEKSFRIPGGYLIPVISIITIVWLLSGLTKKEGISFLLFFLIFSLIYLVLKMKKSIK